MNRLLHSMAGFLRSLQISQTPVFCFVEGKDIDSFFYGALCREVCNRHPFKYQIKRAKEIPQHASGKNALLSLYRYLQSRKKLVSTFNGKKTFIVIFLDKDIDDILKKKCRSPHVIYTEFYDVQNHIFIHGDLSKAIATAASLDEQEVRLILSTQGNWCETAAQRWKIWIVFCLFCQLYGVRITNYRVTSRINSPLNGNVDTGLYNAAIDEARQALDWSEDKMMRKIERIKRLVEKYFKNGMQDVIFKGKWYKTILEHDLRDTFQGKDVYIDGVTNRITTALAATLDFSQPWSKHFTTAIEKIVGQGLS